ncbi:MAG: ABC transporter ATP-binding protein [Bryobacterales bacterium]|nr:ABC transporter ATP-binding protein [Bryobacterales bacterium]
MPPIVRVEGLTHRYGNIQALDNISFTVEEGEIFGLIGADGAGKTTAFQVLAGVMEPTAGTVQVFNQSPRVSRDLVGYLTQRFSFYADLSIIENLRFSAGLRLVPEADFNTRSERYLNAFDLARFRDRLAGRLSGGMKQKLALSCALVASPRLLILDEPTTGVDPVSRRDFWDTLADLAAEGMTILVATPYLDEAERCHRVALIERGQIFQIDSPVGFRTNLGRTRLQVKPADLAQAEADLHRAGLDDVQRFGDRLDILTADEQQGRELIRSKLGALAVIAATPTLENAFVATLRQMRGAEHRAPFPSRTARNGNGRKSLLEATGLEKRFGDFRAVKDFHVNIARGEIYGLLGANGAGKTTAIKMMCGLLKPTRGSVALLGETRGLRSAALRSRIGYMSQKFTLYDDLTIGENLDFYAALYGVPPALRAARKAWVLEVSDLAGEERMLTGQLPGGWKQRVAFGAAIMHEPELVFLDEPTSGVDPLARRAMWRMINELADSGAAILVVTHYLEEAEQCSRIGFMVAGELLLEGAPSEVRGGRSGGLLEVETSDTRTALKALRNAHWPVSQFGNRLHIKTADPAPALAAIRQAGVDIVSERPADFSLEDIFLELVEKQKEAA